MIEPVRAAVRPRVRLQPSGEVVLLEDVVAEHLAAGDVRILLLSGEVGAGTMIAIQHLAERFTGEARLQLEMSAAGNESPREDPPARILIHKLVAHATAPVCYRLEGWGRDEWIEYLLSVHHDRCASVMQRIQSDTEVAHLDGNPSLWRHVLDELVANDDVTTVRAALRRVIQRMFPDRDTRLSVGWRAFLSMAPTVEPDEPQRSRHSSAESLLSPEQVQVSKPFVLLLLAADAVAIELAIGDVHKTFRRQWPKRLVEEVGRGVAESLPVQKKLLALIEPRHRELHPLGASLLHACGIGWRPETSRLFGLRTGWLNLKAASLPNAEWPGIHLSRCDLESASFAGANLAKANLHGANALHANFDDANLDCAVLSRLNAYSASFIGANLTLAYGRKVELERANLSFADLTEAELIRSDLRSANLSEAIFRRACLDKTTFHNAVIDGADFTEADLDGANLLGLDLTVACFTQASFVSAYMRACNLEGMELPNANFAGADLSNALLTGSIIANASFYGANLQEAGLAEIDWEFADLRYANLRGVSFHMGSTRDGLVGSTIPMHGSRTGFYTDDYNEQDFKAPEEIRKANLRGADLRGADITDVDFYLVDLRDALYDAEQEQHFRRCGAILESKGE
ncbi:MAG: pentapeptide repeat-containing protein [Planctomycetaceae bacterium]|nr:pentapeptide repeat-containing protein [Planctomycetaceae bacterium]